MNIFGEYVDYLQKLSKEKLQAIIDDYNELGSIYNLDVVNTKKLKKDDLIKKVDELKSDYFKYWIMSLDLDDFNVLKQLTFKKVNDEFLHENRDFINYLLEKSILFQEQELMMAWDINALFKSLIKNKDVIKYVKTWNKIYKLVDGIIVAYGVVSKKYFDIIIEGMEDKEQIIPKLEYYYKKEYVIDNKKIMSNKLTSKKRINSYVKNDKYKMFTNKEFGELGNSTYHHGIKSYKKFIKMLKNNYVFRNSDIEFVDKNIVIPYLYNSLNEEDEARKSLEETIVTLFEFKGDKLKQKMLEEVMKIRDEFPLWEYRGFTKLEVGNEE